MPEDELIVDLLQPETFDLYRACLPETLVEDFTADEALILFGIRQGLTAIGAAAVYDRGLKAELRFIYIAPSYRFYGLGRQAVRELSECLRDAGYLELIMTYEPRVAPALDRITDDLGAVKKETGRAAFEFALKDLPENSPVLRVRPDHVKCLKEVSKPDRAYLYGKLRESGRDIIPLPPAEDTLAETFCGVYYEERPAGLILVNRVPDEHGSGPLFVISCAVCTGERETGIAELFSYAVTKAKELLSPDAVIRFASIRKGLTAYAETIVGEPVSREVSAGIILRADIDDLAAEE